MIYWFFFNFETLATQTKQYDLWPKKPFYAIGSPIEGSLHRLSKNITLQVFFKQWSTNFSIEPSCIMWYQCSTFFVLGKIPGMSRYWNVPRLCGRLPKVHYVSAPRYKKKDEYFTTDDAPLLHSLPSPFWYARPVSAARPSAPVTPPQILSDTWANNNCGTIIVIA